MELKYVILQGWPATRALWTTLQAAT